MSTNSKKPVLADHKRHRKKLLPPILAVMGNAYSPYSWARELVPELLWIALVLEEFGERDGIEVCNRLGEQASNVCSSEPVPMFAKSSSFAVLNNEQRDSVRQSFDKYSLTSLNVALKDLMAVCPQHALSFLSVPNDNEKREAPVTSQLEKILYELYDRYSRRSAITMSVAFYMGLCQDKIKMPKELADKKREDFDHIVDYPNTERSKSAASSFRAAAPMFLAKPDPEEEDEAHEKWLEVFWEAIGQHGECISEPTIEEEIGEPENSLQELIFEFRRTAKEELKTRLEHWGFDLNRIEINEVVGALLARQTTLATEFSLSPQNWTPTIAPLFLRPMADVHISIVWILNDPLERSKKFIESGLGEVKLEIAHRKAQLEEMGSEEKAQQKRYIDYLEKWLQSQRLEDLVEVNLGSWSGTNTRKMAEEAGCLDFYNYVYQPFSSTIHSSWPHISQFNAVYCENPSHRYHRIPAMMEPDPDPHWLYLAAKYLNKTFRAFDEANKIPKPSQSAFDALLANMNPSSDES